VRRTVQLSGGRPSEGFFCTELFNCVNYFNCAQFAILTHIFSVACVVGSCHGTTEGRFHSAGVEHLSARCDHFQYPGTRRVIKNYLGSLLPGYPTGTRVSAETLFWVQIDARTRHSRRSYLKANKIIKMKRQGKFNMHIIF